MSALTVIAPSDAQLLYIAGLCAERGLERPAAVYSKAEASEIIAAILQGQYDPADYQPASPGFNGAADAEEVGGIGRPKPLRNKRTRGGRATVAAIHAAKCKTCRLCGTIVFVTAHHLIPRGQGGRWHFDNIVGLCGSGTTGCHGLVTGNDPAALAQLAAALTDSEYAYLIEEHGEGALERLFLVGVLVKDTEWKGQ